MAKSDIVRHVATDTGYKVDLADLIFTPDRDFLITNNGLKVRIEDLKGKTVVLYIVPIYESHMMEEQGDILDMVQAYHELLPLGGTEFVFVPIYLSRLTIINNARPLENPRFSSQEAFFNHLFSTIPFPAVPFSDIEACGNRVVRTFSVGQRIGSRYILPYWAIIDPASRVVVTRIRYPNKFKLFGGAELHPLSSKRIRHLAREHGFTAQEHNEARKRLINKWDQLLASPTRDYLISSSGGQVPISSLKGKIIGLYFCENIPCPRRMEVIKKVYAEAKLRGYDFEIVQINFHYHYFNATHAGETADLSVQQSYENIGWLKLPFKDPSCRKLQRIFKCERKSYWEGDCLVIVDARQAEVAFEFSGAEIFETYGIEGYPFTREHLFEMEYRIQKRELKVQSLFPPGLCHLSRPAGEGYERADDLQLNGKRVIVVCDRRFKLNSCQFLSLLKTKYREQLHDDSGEENKFEVVYVSTSYDKSTFMESIKDMPWLVHPYYEGF